MMRCPEVGLLSRVELECGKQMGREKGCRHRSELLPLTPLAIILQIRARLHPSSGDRQRRCKGAMVEVRVLFFARGRELSGTSEALLALEAGSTTKTLMQRLLRAVRATGGSGVPTACAGLAPVLMAMATYRAYMVAGMLRQHQRPYSIK